MVLTRLDIWNIRANKSDLIPTLKEISDHGKETPSGLGKVKRG